MADPARPTSRREAVSAKFRRRPGRRWFVLKEPVVVRDLLAHPAFLPVSGVALLFVLLSSMTVWLTRGGLTIALGRIMDDTRVVRVEFSEVDARATRDKQEVRQQLAPRVYRADQRLLDELDNSIRTLPAVVSAAGTLDKVLPEVAAGFKLTPERVEAVKAQSKDGQPTQTWLARTDLLMGLLVRTPVLGASEFQHALQDVTERLELRSASREPETVGKLEAINVDSDEPDMKAKARRRFEAAVKQAGFFEAGPEVAAVIIDRIALIRQPLFSFDREGTQKRRDEAAAGVEAVRVTHKPGELIYQRGDRLDPDDFALSVRENEHYLASIPATQSLASGIGLLGIAGVLAAALGGYIGVFYRSLATSPWRLAALAGLMVGTLGASCWGSLAYPGMIWFTATAPTIFLAMVCVVAYDRRLVLAVAGSQAMLSALALGLPVTTVSAIMIGVGAAAWQLNDPRHRNDVIRAGLVVAGALGLSVLVGGLLERPPVAGVWSEVLQDAGKAIGAGFFPAVLSLALLPTIERVFGVTTGMTLSELRDTRHPLLRQLQQRAPGTYNHSQTVAVLAESAAEAIGADGLHVYVGALYHDVGKMNKPEYFVENQQGGVSRHARLSPAMSLLVIVGHVKDGAELAREYRLPRSLMHYIESHHGTTLVEYFYDAACKTAERSDSQGPDELEYRYPGPKPRTREAAILMLCDAVEGATRAMTDPTPARIGALVRSIAAKRLADGQFDECELTLRDLNRMEEAVIKGLCSLYHGRVAYPGQDEEEDVGEKTRGAMERSA